MKEFTFRVGERLADNGEWYAIGRMLSPGTRNALTERSMAKNDPRYRIRTVKFLAPDLYQAEVQCDRYCGAEYKDYLEFTK